MSLLMKTLQLLLGQIPEAIFFGLFMIYTKNLRKYRLTFIILVILSYLILKYLFPYSWYFHISFLISTFTELKIIYGKKSQITDIFILLIGYIILGISSIISCLIFRNVIFAVILNRLLIFIPLFIFNYKLNYIQEVYKKYWNRNDKVSKKIKSATFRSMNVVIFNLGFAALNSCMIYALYLLSRR